MVRTATNWQDVIEQVKRTYSHLSPRSYKFIIIVAREAEQLGITCSQATQLGLHFGLKFYPRPNNVPESWKMILCKSHLSQKYINPDDSREYVVVKPPATYGKIPYIVHRTREGYADANWFYEIVPQLEAILKDPTLFPFTTNFNRVMNQLCDNQEKHKMTPGQVQAINLFFEKHVPGLQCLCTTCFKVSLPNSGAGERWEHVLNEKFEVRLSAAKPDARFPGQQVEYVTHRELDDANRELFVTWNDQTKKIGVSNKLRQLNTHIPWDIYDFNKFKCVVPICKCLKK